MYNKISPTQFIHPASIKANSEDKMVIWCLMYLSETVDSFLQSCQLIGYCYSIDFCFYERPQEHICLPVLAPRI